MKFSSWDNIFLKHEWGKYPSEQLVRFFQKKFKNKKNLKILEIGCGTGANLWFFCREGHKAYGLDSSRVAVKICKNFLKKNKYVCNVIKADAKNIPFENNFFDLVIDIECMYSIPMKESIEIANEVYRVLKKKSYFYSLTFSNFCSDFRQMKKTGKIKNFKLKKNVRFSTFKDIKKIFKKYKIENLNRISRTLNNRKNLIDEWEIQAKKIK